MARFVPYKSKSLRYLKGEKEIEVNKNRVGRPKGSVKIKNQDDERVDNS